METDDQVLACGLERFGPEGRRAFGGRVVLFTAASPEHPEDNQDAAALLPWGEAGGVLAVADGVGGERAGAAAARTCLTALAASLAAARNTESSLRAAILDGIEQANRQLENSGSATTVAIVAVEGTEIRPIHVGDSAILIVGQRGRIRHQAIPHGPVGYAIEAGVLDERTALHHEERNVVSNVVGSTEMRIEVGPRLKMNPRDTVLVASDGISDNLFVDEVIRIIRKGPLQAVAETLVRRSTERMTGTGARPSKPDDTTFVLFRLER